MSKIFFWFSSLCLALLLTTACGPKQQETITKTPPENVFPTISDDWGHEVDLSIKPSTIISLTPSNTEIIFAVGGEVLLIGRDYNSKDPIEVLNIPVVTDNNENINVQTIMKMAPDIIIAGENIPPEQVDALEKEKIPVFVVNNPSSFEDMYDNINIIAKIIDRESQAKQLIMQLQEEESELKTTLSSVKEKPLVFYEVEYLPPNTSWTAGNNTYVSAIIEAAKGVNVGNSQNRKWGTMFFKEIQKINPDVILIGEENKTLPMQILQRPNWDNINAIKNNHVYKMEITDGIHMIDNAKNLAKKLHPNCFD